MIGWFILGVYVIGYMLSWRRCVWALTIFGFDDGDRPLGGDIVFGVIFGSGMALVWPVLGVGLGVRRFYAMRGTEIADALVPRHVRRERALLERERRIRSLERELNIR